MTEKRTRKKGHRLGQVYEAYLVYYKQSRQGLDKVAGMIKRVLVAFESYLKRSEIALSHLRIEHIDAFVTELYIGLAPSTCRLYRSHLRGFLRYLYQQRGILRKDLAPLVVGAPEFARSRPPKFLRPCEIKQILANLELTSPLNIRTCAMVHLACLLGLRPSEIRRIQMKDISFAKAQLAVPVRKNKHPLIVPLPDVLLKTIAVYVIGVRPKSGHSELFLTLDPPHRPLCQSIVSRYISNCVKAVNPAASPNWLRHTYAQNLLEAGASIFEIKQMLGHDSIESTRKYLQVHIELMRKVILDEDI